VPEVFAMNSEQLTQILKEAFP